MTNRSLPPLARPRRFQQALGRRLKVLDRDLTPALGHDVEALHRARVASRRLRELIPVIQRDPAGEQWPARARRRVRRVTRALGGVRELDVALALLDELASQHPGLAAAVPAVRPGIECERAARHAEMTRRLEALQPGALASDFEPLADVDGAPPVAEQRRRLRRRVRRRSRRLEEAIEAAGALCALDRLHLVRIAAKKLRYSLELVSELAGVGTRRLVTRLKEGQDLLGRLHDLQVLAACARQARATAPCDREGAAGVAALLEQIDQDTHALHAQYLRLAPRLRLAAAASRRAVAGRLR